MRWTYPKGTIFFYLKIYKENLNTLKVISNQEYARGYGIKVVTQILKLMWVQER